MYRQNTNNGFLDDSGPRPLPAYLRVPPPPPPEEKVRTCVPDISLIFSPHSEKSSNTGRSSPTTAGNGSPQSFHQVLQPTSKEMTKAPSIRSQDQDGVSNSLLIELINLVKLQSSQIQKIDDQLQSLVLKGEEQRPRPSSSEVGVQTDAVCARVAQPASKKPSTLEEPKPYEAQNYGATKEAKTPNHTEDLSNILKDLQIPNSTEQSIYSVRDSPVPLVDLPDFNEHFLSAPLDKSEEDSPGIGPSVSEYGSSDEEQVQPTVTYYRNVLGNVNRLLENNTTTPPPRRSTKGGAGVQSEAANRTNNNLLIQQNVYNSIYIPTRNCIDNTDTDTGAEVPPVAHPYGERVMQQKNGRSGASNATDTTLYGMSSANLSFSTREYLERHGLVQGVSAPSERFRPTNPRPSKRILDSVLKNQPKYM